MGSHAATEAYTNRMPSAPTILLPLPVTNQTHRSQGISVGPAFSRPGQPDNVDYLFNHEPYFIQGLEVHGWKYEYRRNAQVILPYLWIGPSSVTHKAEYLRTEGFTLLLGIQPSKFPQFITGPAIKASRELGIECRTLTADNTNQLISQYDEAAYIINCHVNKFYHAKQTDPSIQDPKVLIFCDSGNNKSAAVAATYLMSTFSGVDHLLAMQALMTRRFCCDFDENIRQSLQNYQDILEAKRQTSAARAANHQFLAPSRPKNKRERDDDDDDMMVDQMADDAERFIGRQNTPFQDHD
ncbi:hypothetical protein BT63DRAFT_425951 [Microthyrium microscopicum]|uniref:Uncharacterized protein n=1 Tax=Microthyrium microscopicum TaxID=703497 RepID=A0A6A6UCL2_9PEZI|nr:hypothetical protein BT63DRAFT_425951 [Microthyrium microscopicum]